MKRLNSYESSVMVDRDPSLHYETRKWPYLVILPLMFIVALWAAAKTLFLKVFGKRPLYTSIFFDCYSDACYRIRLGAASFAALDVIYNYKDGCENWLSDFWVNMINAQAVRNRKRLVKRELVAAMKELITLKMKKEITIFSVASGSAQAVLESIHIIKQQYPEVKFKTILFDRDPKALAYSRKIARKFGLGDCISTVEGTVSRRSNELERAVNCHTPDIVEVIGLLDYLSDSAASALIKRLSGLLHLNGGGFFFTANVAPNPEQFFLKWVIGWPMIYRTDKRLWRVVADAGVSRFQIKYEPHRIHGIVIARVNLA